MGKRLTTEEDAERLRRWFLRYMKPDFEIRFQDGNFVYVFPPESPGDPPREIPIRAIGKRDARNIAASEGFLIGPAQICRRAGLNVSIGTRLFSEGKSKEPYVPFPEYLNLLVEALHDLLEEFNHPSASEVTKVQAYIEGGYLTEEDVKEFVESKGLDGWMKEEDCFDVKALNLGELDVDGETLVRELANFLYLRQEKTP